MQKTMTPQQAYGLLKGSQWDYLGFDGPDEDGRYFVFIGEESDKPFTSFQTEDEADEFVNAVHAIVNRVRSAGNLRSFFP